MNILKWFKKEKPIYSFPEYADTDPNKLPLYPPNIIMYESLFSYHETEFSKQRTAAWEEYMKKREERRNEKNT